LIEQGIGLKEVSQVLNLSYGYVRKRVCLLRKRGIKIPRLKRGRPPGIQRKQGNIFPRRESKNVTRKMLPDDTSYYFINILNDKELHALRLLWYNREPMRSRNIARIIGVSGKYVYKILRRLVKLGLVRRLGWGLYTVNEERIFHILALLGKRVTFSEVTFSGKNARLPRGRCRGFWVGCGVGFWLVLMVCMGFWLLVVCVV